MDTEVRHLFIEIERKGTSYDATLSDDSIDRDGEFFSPELIKEWGKDSSPLPFLANHENSMQNLVGAWTNRRVVQENGNTMLKMQPSFFSEQANPLAQQLKRQIDEATAMGLRIGLSIGFIPMESMMVATRLMHTQAELVEGSAVPVQSNRHASISLAKSFRLKNDSIKKTSQDGKDGDNMATLEQLATELATVKADTANVKTENEALKAKIAALEGRQPELTAEQKAKIEATEKEVADLKAKQEKNEKEMGEKIKAYEDNYNKLKAEVEKPKGKLPLAMRGAMGIEKDPAQKEEGYNATKAWVEQHMKKSQ